MPKKKLLLIFIFYAFTFCSMNVFGQKKSKNINTSALKTSPKLLVGIVVDQMRYDYLTRFWNHFNEGGFKRLVNEGFNCKNNHLNYAPTSTGPGHASIYTGTTPAVHGVIGNQWYDKVTDKELYCVSDDRYTSIGTTLDVGEMSPHRMNVTTITDELRLHTQQKGKTIAIALKDRGAVLSGGHTANAAYWFHGGNEGKWITSRYYMEELPKWVKDFNASGKIKSYKKPWITLKDSTTYIESGSDTNAYEGFFEGESTSSFPHNPPDLLNKAKGFDILKTTPYGNSITTDFVIEALKEGKFGYRFSY